MKIKHTFKQPMGGRNHQVSKYLETNWNENISIYQVLWDVMSTVLRSKYMAINAYI